MCTFATCTCSTCASSLAICFCFVFLSRSVVIIVWVHAFKFLCQFTCGTVIRSVCQLSGGCNMLWLCAVHSVRRGESFIYFIPIGYIYIARPGLPSVFNPSREINTDQGIPGKPGHRPWGSEPSVRSPNVGTSERSLYFVYSQPRDPNPVHEGQFLSRNINESCRLRTLVLGTKRTLCPCTSLAGAAP